MRTRMYGGVRGRKTKVGGKPTFVFLLLDCCALSGLLISAGDDDEVAEGVGLKAEDVCIVTGGDTELLSEGFRVHRDVACSDFGARIGGTGCLDRSLVERLCV